MSWFANLSIARKLALAFATLVVIIAVVGGLTMHTLATIRESNRFTAHTLDVMEAGRNALAAMVDQETGLRGYLIVGDKGFLGPYARGQERFARNFDEA